MKKILLVEDDKYLGLALVKKFEQSNFKVVLLEDGGDIFPTLEKFYPDVMILDLMLPIKDGSVILTELKASNLYKGIPVLIATNVNDEQVRIDCLNKGAVEYFVKSDLSIDDLLVKVEQILKKSAKK